MNAAGHTQRPKRSILTVVAITILAVWALTAVSITNARRTAIDDANNNAENLSAAFAEEINYKVRDIEGAMSVVADEVIERHGNFNIYDMSDQIRKISPSILQAGLIGPDGWLRSTTLEPHPVPIDVSDRESFRVPVDPSFQGIYISKPVTGGVTGQVTILFSRRIESKEGRFLGVLVFSIPPKALTALHKSINLGRNDFIGLVGLDNVVRARFSSSSPDGLNDVGQTLGDHPTPAELSEKGDGIVVRSSSLDHITRIISYRRIPGYPLVVGVGLDLDAALAGANAHARTILIAVGVATLLLGSLMIYLMHEIDRRTANDIALARERQKLGDANISLQASKERAEQGEARTRYKSLILQGIFDYFPAAITVIDRDLRIVAFNQKLLTLLDLPKELMEVGVPMAKVFLYNAERGEYGPGDPKEQVRERIELASQFIPHNFERTRPDGRTLEIIGNLVPEVGFVTFYTDITARKRAEEELRRALQRAEKAEILLTDAIDCVSEAFVIFDKDDRLVLCNDLYWKLYPPSPELLKPGVSFVELLRYNLAHGAYKDAIGREEEWLAEHLRMHQQANLVVEQSWYDGRHLMVTDRRTKSGGTAGLRIDITQLVQTREALEKALTKAESVNEAKTLFLANMSHELRTPLNAIIGFSQMIRDQVLGPAGVPAYAEYAKDIHDSGDHLLEIITNMLDASRIEVGKFDLKEDTVEIGELAQSAVQTVRVQAAKKSIALTIRLPEEPYGLRADTLRLRQILINLLANAVKFTPEGGRVTLSFEASPAAAVFAVADTGIGMSPDEIAVATEPFHQIENTLVKRHEGVGLGLSLAKHMTEMHGGTFEIESEKDVGTTVRVVLPAERILRVPNSSAAA